MLWNKKVWGQEQASQININAVAPNVSVCVASTRAARAAQPGSCRKRSGGRRCQGEMLLLPLAWGCSREMAQANLSIIPRDLWSFLSLSISRLDTKMPSGTPCLPLAVPCMRCLCSHFWTYAMARGQSSLQRSRAARDAGSLHPHGAP